ncbi:MAG: hypothetical protein AAF960_20730 [Bacteroidota bacterium]
MTQLIFRWSALGLLLPLLAAFFQPNLPTQQITVPFYSEKIVLNHADDLFLPVIGKLEEQSIVNYYESLAEEPFQPLLQSLKKAKYQFQLNDWLLYELTEKSVGTIFPEANDKENGLITWFLSSKMGYDTRLAFLKNEVLIYVRTEDDIYETPLIEDRGHRFVGLTELKNGRNQPNRSIYLLNFLAAPNGEPFKFSLEQLPQMTTDHQKRTLRFVWDNETHEVDIVCDKNLVDILKKYPVIGETDYIKTPFSAGLKKSLLPQIRQIIAGKSTVEALQIITTFTRSAFKYQEDERYFGHSKPMIRDEVFFYPYSDCEDRSAVFFGLVEALLDLPMIIVAFPDHLTVAVALDEPIGPSIRYKGNKFYICDPTGPYNSSEIGKIPSGYEQQSFEILMDNL